MNIIEILLSAIAPHLCVGCGHEGSLLCGKCQPLLPPPIRACFKCKKPSSLLCLDCQEQTDLDMLLASTQFSGLARQLVHALKFKRGGMTAAQVVAKCLPPIAVVEDNIVITHLPTATSRIRTRGYDQAALIARFYARYHQRRYRALLSRHGQTRQVGQDRHVRLSQARQSYTARFKNIQGTIVLIDDVITTGSSMEAAAKIMRQCGAQKVIGLTFALAT